MGLTERILSRAHTLGFERAGVAPAEPLPGGDALRDWLDLGYHGEMGWMERTRHIRDQPTRVLEGARSIISLAFNYNVEGCLEGPGEIARYARGYDYHTVLEHKLETLKAFIEVEAGVPARARGAVDRLPLLERDVAHLAGIGWFGKNTMIINREVGSYLFLAELVVDLDLETNTAVYSDYCGSCTACIDACPTKAIVGPRLLDARRCISYLTIETRGPIPRELRRDVGMHLFGCDICQVVCPWNRKAPHTAAFAFKGRAEIISLTAVELLQLEDERTFRARLQLSPTQRPGRPGLLRNAAVVLGNTGDRRHLPLLIERLQREAEPLVRGHIAWALGALGGDRARTALEHRRSNEPDPYVREEIRQALSTC